MEVLGSVKKVLPFIKSIAYTSYELEERASGWQVILATATDQMVFQINEDLDPCQRKDLYQELALYQRKGNAGNSSLTPDWGFTSTPNHKY